MPNEWTANYKTYFLHLNSRISGQHPDLRACEMLISQREELETGPQESVRPRAIYHDDKNNNFTLFADYLIPSGRGPWFSPKEFAAILRSCDWGFGWVEWDVLPQEVSTDSDHFDLDHYTFYKKYHSAFQGGWRTSRLSELASYDRWPGW
jgi:hypothetical protein